MVGAAQFRGKAKIAPRSFGLEGGPRRRYQANAVIEALSLPNVGLKFTKNGVFGNFDSIQSELAANETLRKIRESHL